MNNNDVRVPHTPLNNANQVGSCILKPPLTFEQQINRLKEHGFDVSSYTTKELIDFLGNNNYYRISGYWVHLQKDGEVPQGTNFKLAVDALMLDKELRAFLFEMIEAVEVKLRCELAYHLSLKHETSNILLNEDLYHPQDAEQIIQAIKRDIKRSRANKVPCVLHNEAKYGVIPAWALVEILSFGTLVKIYMSLTDEEVRKDVAKTFTIKVSYLVSWLRHLRYIRNVCAHFSRAYNLLMTSRAKLHNTINHIDNTRLFSTLVVLFSLHKFCFPDTVDAYFERIVALFEKYPEVDLKPLGMPQNWQEELQQAMNAR